MARESSYRLGRKADHEMSGTVSGGRRAHESLAVAPIVPEASDEEQGDGVVVLRAGLVDGQAHGNRLRELRELRAFHWIFASRVRPHDVQLGLYRGRRQTTKAVSPRPRVLGCHLAYASTMTQECHPPFLSHPAGVLKGGHRNRARDGPCHHVPRIARVGADGTLSA